MCQIFELDKSFTPLIFKSLIHRKEKMKLNVKAVMKIINI